MRPVSYSSEILTEGYLGNLTTLKALQHRCRLSNDQAARLCFVSPQTYRRWRADRQPNPMAVRLLAIQAGYVPWHGWENWEMHNGYLFPPGFTKHGISPGDLHASTFLQQLVSEQRRRITELERQIPSRRTSSARSL